MSPMFLLEAKFMELCSKLVNKCSTSTLVIYNIIMYEKERVVFYNDINAPIEQVLIQYCLRNHSVLNVRIHFVMEIQPEQLTFICGYACKQRFHWYRLFSLGQNIFKRQH